MSARIDIFINKRLKTFNGNNVTITISKTDVSLFLFESALSKYAIKTHYR